MDDLPLSQALESLRRELMDAVEGAGDSWLRFAVKSIELELNVTATAGGTAQAGVSIWHVVTVGGSVNRSSEAVHRVLLTLEPRKAGTGDPAEILVGEEGTLRPR